MVDSTDWVAFHRKRARTGDHPKWPNEVMLKTVFGQYLREPIDVGPDCRVLDVGTGFGNNLLPFADAGCDCHGVEIDTEIAEITERVLRERGYEATIQRGTNQSLPYDGRTFDLLLSVNVIHYEPTDTDVRAALEESARVLKPTGAVFLMTVGPRHELYRRSQRITGHRFEVENYDFRTGETMFFFDDQADLGAYLEGTFEDVETGRVTEDLMERELDFLVAVGRRG